MSEFADLLANAISNSYISSQQTTKYVVNYVKSGDKKHLAAAKKIKTNRWDLYWAHNIFVTLPTPEQLSEEQRRFITVVAYLHRLSDYVEHSLEPLYKAAELDSEKFADTLFEILGSDDDARELLSVALIDEASGRFVNANGKPTSAGRFLLEQSDDQLNACLQGEINHSEAIVATTHFLLAQAPKRVPALAKSLLETTNNYGKYLSDDVARELLKHDRKQYEKLITELYFACDNLGQKFRVGVELARYNDKLLTDVRQIAQRVLKDSNLCGMDDDVCSWLVQTFGGGALTELADYLRSTDHIYMTSTVLENTVTSLGKKPRPAFFAALENKMPNLRLVAVEQLITWNDDSDRSTISEALRLGLKEADSQNVIRFLTKLRGWDFSAMAEDVWNLLEHKSKPARGAAARALAGLEGAVQRAIPLLKAKKSSTRSAAVTLLATAQTPEAAKGLEARLDEETDEEVRDQMLLALESVWEKQGKKVSRKDIEKRVEATKSKLQEPVCDWLEEKKLPALAYAGGKGNLSPETVRYLLYRQSRAKTISPDVEAKPLYALIDRKTSGDFALAVLQGFLRSKMEADDRWALAMAGMLGDDRCVTLLMQQIRKWVEANRGKLAEYATQALALLGSDVALCAVDSLSIRYRSKQKNIGKAASEAFTEAAERLGISPDELGDRVVPWLGFEPGAKRILENGGKKIEVRISLDHKLEFHDLEKGKKIGSLPAAIPAEVKAEFKDLGATLREVLKGQFSRMENLMVRQFRWPVARWKELYLQHPVLFPFATRLAWGVYGKDGKLVQAFRALEDRSLTNELDESVTLPRDVQIGIVHPLEMSAESRKGWATHLADYAIETPFPQMGRPVVFPKPEQTGLKFSTQYQGTELNAMTFKSRAERLGWQRGSVIDGGGISAYRKSFPGAGAEAILGLEGMYIGIGMDSSIKLERLCFIKTDSVTFGSYTYDEPSNDKDERLIQFDAVPPIVFSETMGDLTKIAGSNAADASEEAG